MSLSNSALQSISYNVENRVATVTAVNSSYESYRYSAGNERLVVLRQGQFDEVYFYDINGTLLEVYRVERGVWTNGVEQLAWSYPVRVPGKERIYFHGRLLAMATDAGGIEAVVTDRLGSVVKRGSQTYRYHPYGQEIGGATVNDKPKFGTYTRDAISGLDYAMNRHYYSIWGRFTSPDPYQASGGVADPGSWNRYTYVQGDPVNLADPSGLMGDPCADVGEIMPNSTCEYRMRNAGGSNHGWSNGAFDPYLGAPPSMRLALQQYDAGVTATYIDNAAKSFSITTTLTFEDGTKYTHVNEGDFKQSRSNIMSLFQTGLDIVGFIPGAGEAADGMNALIYGAQGDWANAAISSAAAGLPLAGDSLKLPRIAGKIAGYTRHGIHSAISHKGGGVNQRSILNAVRDPVRVVEQIGGALRYEGRDATVTINRRGSIITTWPTSREGRRIP